MTKTTNNSAATQVIDFTSIDLVYAAAKNSSYTVAPMLASMILKTYATPYLPDGANEEQFHAGDAQQAAMTATIASLVIRTIITEMAKGEWITSAQLDEVVALQSERIMEVNPDVQIVNTAMLDIVAVMKEAGIVDYVSSVEEGINYDIVVPTRNVYNTFFKVSALVPQYQPILSTTDRRTRQASASSKKAHLESLAIIKGGKAKPNAKLKSAIDFLQSTPFMLDGAQLEIINALYRDEQLKSDLAELRNELGEYAPELTLLSNQFVVTACNTIDENEYLFSEHGTCKRGRIMPLCFGAPNLQSGDLCRSLYNVVSTQPVMQDHVGVQFFKNEMKEAAGGFKLTTASIKNIALNSLEFLKCCLRGQVNVDEPFKLVKMCREWVAATEAWNKGEGYIFTTPVGLDAKSSGTQILALLAGDAEVADRCGLTTIARNDKERKQADPYSHSGRAVNAATGYTFDRNDMKTPYMAIQYGGSWKAIYKQKAFKMACAKQGLFTSDEVENMARQCAALVKQSLGHKINGLISTIEYNVRTLCEKADTQSMSYKHLDGFMVTVNDTKKISAGWAGEINLTRGDRLNAPVRFGMINPETNEGTWTISVGSDLNEFVRKFVVHLVQGVDAMLARTVANNAKVAGIEGYATIHDCFRTCVADAGKLLPIIQDAYLELFSNGDIIKHLETQIGELKGYFDADNAWIPYTVAAPIDASLFTEANSYYFC